LISSFSAGARWVKDDRVKFYNPTVTTAGGDEYIVWPVMHMWLTKNKLRSLPQEEALKMAKSGKAKFLDIRLAEDFAKEHIEGALNAPLFRVIPNDTGRLFDTIKRIAMAGIAMKATERNPDFLSEAERVLGSRNTPVIVYCPPGGTMETKITGVKVKNYPDGFADKDRSFGRESRSLKACYELMSAGFKNVYHLEGGMSKWRYDGRPMADL